MKSEASTRKRVFPMHEYESSMEWTSGREGKVSAPGLPDLAVASPPEFGGRGGLWSPEHLFVASANSCVLLTFLAIAEFSKLAIRSASASARGLLEKPEGKGLQFTAIDVTLRIQLEKESDRERAERLARKAEAACLVSSSMKTPVRVTPEIGV
jgi:peroxiredoxin-like protein